MNTIRVTSLISLFSIFFINLKIVRLSGPVQSRMRRRRADGSRHAPYHPQVQGRVARAHGRTSRAQTGVGLQRFAAQPPDGLPHERTSPKKKNVNRFDLFLNYFFERVF